jgi:hypothetical protein
MLSLVQGSKYCFRRSGSKAPSLSMAHSFWALKQRERTIDQLLDEASSDGFEYCEVGLRDEYVTEMRGLMNKHPLKLIAQGWAASVDEAVIYLQRAVEIQAIALNLHLGHAYFTANEAVDFVEGVQHHAKTYGIPLLLETHRGRLTQDLLRTGELLARLPETVITLDVSHYMVAGEVVGRSDDLFRGKIAPLLARTALVHGRISNGQAIQVSAGDRFARTSLIQSLWQQAMELWLRNAPVDAVFIFEPELGPPPYAYLDSSGGETFNRTVESGMLAQLAREAWVAAGVSAGYHA